MNRKNDLLVVLLMVFIVFGLGLRLAALQSIPTSLTHDEIYYAVQSRFLAVTGSDPAGVWQPWQLTSAHPLFAELPGLVVMLGHTISDLPLIAVRLPSVAMGLLLPFLLGIVSFQLFRKKQISIAVVLLTLFNPWAFQFSRMVFDAWFSTFFYLCGISLVLSNRRWLVLLSIPVFTLGFFQYQGMKLLLVPLLISLVLYQIWVSKRPMESLLKRNHLMHSLRNVWPQLLVLLYCFLLMGWFVSQLSSQSAQSRTNDIVSFNMETVKKLSVEGREFTVAPMQYAHTIGSTYALYRSQLEKLANVFSSDRLFMQGNTLRDATTVTSAGLFHWLDLVLLIAGVVFFFHFRQYRPVGMLLLSWMLIATIPALLSLRSDWPLYRTFFLMPTLLLICGAGLYFVVSKLPKFASLTFIVFYCITSFYFFSEYFFKYPVYSSETKYYAERVVASYALRAGVLSQVDVRVDEPDFAFYNYVLTIPNFNAETAKVIQQSVREKNFQHEKVTYNNDCVELEDLQTVLITDDTVATCSDTVSWPTESVHTIVVPPHNRTLFTIYNDSLCTAFEQSTVFTISNILVPLEQLNDKEFCEKFILISQR